MPFPTYWLETKDPPPFLPDRYEKLWRESEPGSLTRMALLELAEAFELLEQG